MSVSNEIEKHASSTTQHSHRTKTMTDKMLLERVSYWLRRFDSLGERGITSTRWGEMADAIDDEIAARGEPVAWRIRRTGANLGAYDRLPWLTSHEGDAEFHLDLGDEVTPLYTAPPTAKVEVTDAMVDTAMAAYCGAEEAMDDEPMAGVDPMRAALEAALVQGGHHD